MKRTHDQGNDTSPFLLQFCLATVTGGWPSLVPTQTGIVPAKGWSTIQQCYPLNTATEPRNCALNNYAKRGYYNTKLYISHYPIKQNRTKTKQSLSTQIYTSYHPLLFSIFLMKPWSTYNCPHIINHISQKWLLKRIPTSWSPTHRTIMMGRGTLVKHRKHGLENLIWVQILA